MAISQVNGNQPTPSSTRNNGGAVINAGNSESCSSLSSSNSIKHVGTIDNNHTDKILVSGLFNHQNLFPLSQRITKTLAQTINNNGIYYAEKDPKIKSIHTLRNIRTNSIAYSLRHNKYNFFTGHFDMGYPYSIVDLFGSDLSYQKQFTINTGNPVPASL